MNLSASGEGKVAGICEYGNGPSGFCRAMGIY